MTSPTRALKRKATQLAGNLNDRNWDTSIPGVLRREIALTMDQMDRTTELHEKQLRRLLRQERYVNTERMQLEAQMPPYSSSIFSPRNDKLQKRLFEIENQKRNLKLGLEEKLKPMEDKLLSLIHKHEQLDL